MIPRAAHVSDPAIRRYIGRIRVSVNGHEQSFVTSYDVDAGVVDRYETHSDGSIVIRGDSASIETVRGAVRVWIE